MLFQSGIEKHFHAMPSRKFHSTSEPRAVDGYRGSREGRQNMQQWIFQKRPFNIIETSNNKIFVIPEWATLFFPPLMGGIEGG